MQTRESKVFVVKENGRAALRVLTSRGGVRMLVPGGNDADDVMAYLAKHLPPPTEEDCVILSEYGVGPL